MSEIMMLPYVLSVMLTITIMSVGRTTADHCSSSPCLNGGTCFDAGHSYECTCPAGYRGPKCQLATDSCVVNSCQHGVCEHVSSSEYRCNCDLGWTADDCGTVIDECTPAPCQNGGTCVDRLGSFLCNCAFGYAGVNCESPVGNLALYNTSLSTSSDAWKGFHWYANDGIRTNDHHDPICPNKCCTHTDSELDPWWQMTLNQTFPIRHIKILNRIDKNLGAKLRKLTVQVDNQFCAYHEMSNVNTAIVNMYCPEGMTGSTIHISKKNHKTLSMCEVELYGYIGVLNK